MFAFEERVVESCAGGKYLELILSGAISIAEVARLKELLLDRFAQHDHIIMDLGQVDIVGFPLFQLLCATNKYVQLHGKIFELKNHCTGTFIDHAQSLGFLREQGCASAEDPSRCLWISQNL